MSFSSSLLSAEWKLDIDDAALFIRWYKCKLRTSALNDCFTLYFVYRIRYSTVQYYSKIS